MKPPPPLRAVLFDRDDTIAYTDPGIYREAAQWAAGRFGLDAAQVGQTLRAQWTETMSRWWHLRTVDDEAAFWTDYGEELARRLGLPASAAAEWMETYPYERYMKPVPGAREVLTELRDRGLKVGVLSNTLPSIGRTLEAVGLADLVDVAVASCTLGVHKPEAEAFVQTLRLLDAAPAEVLFIDDRLDNVEAALALGMRARVIDLRAETPGALHGLGKVLEVLDNLNGAGQDAGLTAAR